MISFLRGTVAALDASMVVLDVGGVGYRVTVPATTRARLPAVGEAATIHTYLHLREDGLELFGFGQPEEVRLFETLLKVTGIGPRLALNVLSALSPRDFLEALLFEDLAALTRVPGIGRKTAQRLVLELKERLAGMGPADLQAPVRTGSPARDAAAEAMEALVALGYSRLEAGRALDRAVRDLGDGAGAPALLKASLKHL
ncbi:MAG: Holliday junction branch migration protein RuvA [bacterium]|nr:Holliday junction branch migration protein RuvA [bacterium]